MIFHDRIEVSAARLLFRIGNREGLRAKGIAEVRHMLHWLGVLMDDLP